MKEGLKMMMALIMKRKQVQSNDNFLKDCTLLINYFFKKKKQQALDLQRQAELEQEEMERRAIDSKERQKMERRKWLNKLHIFQRYRCVLKNAKEFFYK